MQLMPLAFDLGDYHHTQLTRQGDWGLYEQIHVDNPDIIRYAVIPLHGAFGHIYVIGSTLQNAQVLLSKLANI